MKFAETDVWGFAHALRGMRNPKNSWNQSDSWPLSFDDPDFGKCGGYWIGPKDMKLAQTLIKAGPEHRKFLRQIFVSVDITAPLYWWKEFDTYKVGTVANSTSTMHKLMSKPITRESFEIDDFCEDLSVQMVDQSSVTDHGRECDFKAHWHMDMFVDYLIEQLEDIRQDYIRWQEAAKLPTGDVEWIEHCEEMQYHLWKELVRWLPEGWLQTRTVTMNYENLLAMCSKGQRRFHKLNEWSGKEDPNLTSFIAWARTLPYAQEFIFIDEMFVPTPAEVCGKALRGICGKLAAAQMTEQDFSALGVTVLNPDGTFKSVFEVFSELAKKFDKNEIF